MIDKNDDSIKIIDFGTAIYLPPDMKLKDR